MNQRWLFLSGLVDPMPYLWAPPPAARWAPGASPSPLAFHLSLAPWGGVMFRLRPTSPLLLYCPGALEDSVAGSALPFLTCVQLTACSVDPLLEVPHFEVILNRYHGQFMRNYRVPSSSRCL